MTTVVSTAPFANQVVLADYLAVMLEADVVTTSSTTSHEASSATLGIAFKATGTGFSYLLDLLDGGTVTSIVVTKPVGVGYTVTGSFEWSLSLTNLTPAGTGAPFFNGNDTITGSESGEITPGANDLLSGYDGNDTIFGRGGIDFIQGGKGNDKLDGGDGNDTIFGDHGADAMNGGAGDDQLVVIGADGAGDTFQGGAGTDTLVISSAFAVSGVLTNFNALASSIEILKGNGLPILGTSGANSIDLSGLTVLSDVPYVDGGGGNDVITGTSLVDNDLRGGDGDDQLNGGTGIDSLSGGPGVDTFLFDDVIAKAKAALDHIADFAAALDEIQLDRSFFKGLKIGDLRKKALLVKKNADQARDADDRLIYDPKSGEFYFDKDGKGGAKATAFAILDNSPNNLKASDIEIVA